MTGSRGSVVCAAAALLSVIVLCQVSHVPEHHRGRFAGRGAEPSPRGCAVPEFSDEELDAVELLTSKVRRARRLTAAQVAAGAQYLGTIKVVFHVIYYTQGGQDIGKLTAQQVQNQIDWLSDAYENLDFELHSVTYTNNQSWYFMTPGSSAETACKTALVVDSSRYLNIYSVDGVSNGLLGWATFPWDQAAQPNLDGVVIAQSTIPGNPPPYGEGDTAVHEVGHWCGLYHTFQGRCSPRNDLVADTPAEQTATSGCPVGKDTCRQAGLDPIENYMDYSYDNCMYRFSDGQYTRMSEQLQLYRPNALNP